MTNGRFGKRAEVLLPKLLCVDSLRVYPTLFLSLWLVPMKTGTYLPMNIREGSIREAAVKQLLVDHTRVCCLQSPESVHALSEAEFEHPSLIL